MLLPVRYRLVESAHAGSGRAGRGRRYQARVPYARTPGVRRRRRSRGGRQRELQGQPDRIVERVGIQHAGLLAVRHDDAGTGRNRGGCTVVSATDGAAVASNDPNGRTPLTVAQRPCTHRRSLHWTNDRRSSCEHVYITL